MALEIVQILAAGTFGHVAVVRDTVAGDLYAAKVLKAEHLENRKLVRRIRDEALLLSRLDHPNIVGVHGIREVEGRPVLLLEWIRGAPLDALLVQNPDGLPPAEACEIIAVATAALQAAHDTFDPVSGERMRVIHRDFKPSNVLLSVDGVVKVLDFGIAKGNFVGKESETITIVLGAHGYLAPERLDGAEDAATGDIYALGCSLFELLTARRMKLSLHAPSHEERMAKELMRMPLPGTNARIVREMTDLLMGMVAYDPYDRPDHAQVIEALARIRMASGWAPDLPRLARNHVVPWLEHQTFESALRHPAYPDLRFMESPTGATPRGAPPRESDAAIRAFLATEGWQHRTDQLKRLLAADPSWTATPLLEALERLSGGRFWRRWRTDPEGREQLVALLELLRARPEPRVAKRVKPLLRHPDPEVCELARQISTA